MGELLGEGWGPGCLTPYPQPARPDQAAPTPTTYVCDAHLDNEQIERIDWLVASDRSLTAVSALAVGERDPEGARKSLRQALAEHAEKIVRGGDPEPSPDKGG